LKPGGVFIPADPMKNAADFVSQLGSGRRVKALAVSKGKRQTLERIAVWIADGKLRPIVDSEFPLERYHDAVERFSTRGKLGKVVLRLSN